MENKDMKLLKSAKILGLDISTKCIGFALFDINGAELLELTHFSPKIMPRPDDKIEELLKKSDLFKEHLSKYKDIGITKVIIEEPLLNSNNIYTVGTLIRYNSMILKSCYEILGVVPTFISTYNARKFAFPDLFGVNDKGNKVLFGGLPKDIDKKKLIWEHVNQLFPEVEWFRDKHGKLKKENYDAADAATCVIGYINMIRSEN
jgi:hypothetical protein